MKNLYSIAILLTMLFIGNIIFILKLTSDVEVKGNQPTSIMIPVDGLFVYTDCEPNQKYDILSELTSTFSLRVQYDDVRDNFINETQRKYPDADGLILNLKAGRTDKATVIKFIE